jgi:hypothetical protein
VNQTHPTILNPSFIGSPVLLGTEATLAIIDIHPMSRISWGGGQKKLSQMKDMVKFAYNSKKMMESKSL